MVLAAGCQGSKEPASPGPATPALRPIPETGDPSRQEQDRVDGLVQRTLKLVAEVRELEPAGGVKGRVVSREEMLRKVKEELRTQMPPTVLAAQREMLVLLHTVPLDFDYEAAVLELMGDQLAGFYEPRDKTMYLAGDLGSAGSGETLAHELVHALQDQHFNLGQYLDFREDQGDFQSAVHTVAEGDATSAMIDATYGQAAIDLGDGRLQAAFRVSAELGSGPAVPSIIKRSVVAPYVDGLEFVHWARRRAGWQEVNRIWRQLPQSTEQVLHPEKLLAREIPVDVQAPPGPRAGAESVYRDVIGEQGLRLLFEEWMPRFKAEESASDWAGDRLVVFRDADRRFALAWRVRYDTESAGERGMMAFARGILAAAKQGDTMVRPEEALLPVSEEDASAAVQGDRLCRERAKRGPFALARAGERLAIVAGPFRSDGLGSATAASCPDAARWAEEVLRY